MNNFWDKIISDQNGRGLLDVQDSDNRVNGDRQDKHSDPLHPKRVHLKPEDDSGGVVPVEDSAGA